MNYTKLITKKKQYKYSVNICLDLRTEERLADFIPNLTTTEIIREYLGGIIRGNSDTHSRILYALKVSHLSGACSGRFLVLPPLTLVALHGEQKYLMRSLPSFIF